MRRFRFAAVASVALALGLGAAGCLPVLKPKPDPPTTTTTTTTTKPAVDTLLQPGEPNPYGPSNKGEFVAVCPFSHTATVDPIVSPGVNPFGHSHDFFGNVHTDQDSIPESLRGQDTTCVTAFDASGYWVPTLFDTASGTNVQVTASSATFFYRVNYPQDPAKVEPFPADLLMIAGNAKATAPQASYVEHWSCASTPNTQSALLPASCAGSEFVLTLTFPECWDGVNVNSADHKSHMAYALGNSCPADHPHLVPQLTYEIHWPDQGADDSKLALSSDLMASPPATPGTTTHGDFMNGWSLETMNQRVTQCLQKAVICDKDGIVTGS